MSKKIKVTLRKSLIGQKKKIRLTARALGLRKIGKVKEFDDTPVIRGMIMRVIHMVEVDE